MNKKKIYPVSILLILFLLVSGYVSAQVTGLSGWKLFIDPGHSQTENMGLYNYSEAEKNLRVALALKNILESQTDIGEIYSSRTTDEDYISLEGRTTLANEMGVDFYYSIHSDAGSPSVNSVLTLYGGWRSNGVTVEKTPEGGAAFGDILNVDLSGAMRIPTRGNWADRNFYDGIVDNHTNQWPYLYVNRTTNMASLLSEAGFHTNPGQQQLNLNAEWKKLEAFSAFRSLLEFLEIDRPDIAVITGIISDSETGLPANGVNVTIGDKQYTTDSYESLFNQYIADHDELHNGFYWIEGLTPGEEVNIMVNSDEFQSKTVTHTVSTNPNGRTSENLNFVDIELVSVVPAVITGIEPSDQLNALIPGTDVVLEFSRKMDQTSVEQSVSISPGVNLSFTWPDEFTLVVNTDNLEFDTQYSVTIDGEVAMNSVTGQLFDGDADGIAGGNYQFDIKTSPADVTPPQLVDYSPSAGSPAESTNPFIRLVFDEELKESSVDAVDLNLTVDGSDELIPGTVKHCVVKEQSVIHFFPTDNLMDNTDYTLQVGAGLQDIFGNTAEAFTVNFSVSAKNISSSTMIDSFDSGIFEWWNPQSSGSTSGINTELTSRTHEVERVVLTEGSTGSMKLSYGWDEFATNPYIRLYLPPGSSQNTNRFGPDDVLEVFLFGDGSGNEFRFMIKDGNSTYEASPWYTVDWKGWKKVSWDLANDPAIAWVNGNGVIDGDGGFYLDGFHFRRGSNGDLEGTFFFDELKFVKYGEATGLENLKETGEVVVFPNPVKNELHIKAPWDITEVQIFSLNGQLVEMWNVKGQTVSEDLSNLTPGYYIIKVSGENSSHVQKIVVIQ